MLGLTSKHHHSRTCLRLIWVLPVVLWLVATGFRPPALALPANEASEQKLLQLSEAAADSATDADDNGKDPHGAWPAHGLHAPAKPAQSAPATPLGKFQRTGPTQALYLLYGALRLGGC